jgi:hypothetical protein
MPIFARQRLRAMLDDLWRLMDSVKVNELLSHPQRRSADTALAAELELAMLWAASRVAHREVEPALAGTRRRANVFSE